MGDVAILAITLVTVHRTLFLSKRIKHRSLCWILFFILSGKCEANQTRSMKWNAPLLGGGAARDAPAEEEDLEADAQADKVYRPLLFQSKGYASSELFRDTYEMRARMRENQQQLVSRNSQDDHPDSKRDARSQAHIRLETLSSRAATTVLGITYLVFVFAFVLPYILDQSYLETVRQQATWSSTNEMTDWPCDGWDCTGCPAARRCVRSASGAPCAVHLRRPEEERGPMVRIRSQRVVAGWVHEPQLNYP